MMHWKYRRLVDAMLRLHTFNLFVDAIALALFAIISVNIANKFLSKKLIEGELFDMSWFAISACAVIFIVLFTAQIYKDSRRQRELSAFEREAAIKAARKNNYRRR